jgi:thymidylate synthase
MNPAFAIAEIVWIVNGRNDAAFLNYWNPALPRFQGYGPVYHGAYGHRLRTHFGVDQLARAAEVLRVFPNSRQVVLQLWDPVRDLPRSTGEAAADDIPCNVVSLLKVRSGRLEWLQIMRSNDLIRGFPYNIVQFTTLQEVLAGWIGVEVGHYHHIADSLHVYTKDLEVHSLRAQSQSQPNTDALAIPAEASLRYWQALSQLFDRARSPATGAPELLRQLDSEDFPEAFRNMGCVALADAARRKNDPHAAERIMKSCTNPAFSEVWQFWLQRTAGSA